MLDDKGKKVDNNNQDEILVRPPVPKSNTDDKNTMFTHPVNMGGKDTNIWPIEVEKYSIFFCLLCFKSHQYF